MAKRKPTGRDNRKDLEQQSFRIDDSVAGAPEVSRAVCDETTHDKLDTINASLGGSNDTTPNIYNVDVFTAGVELSQLLPADTKNFIIKSRNKGELKLAYSLGGTGIDYITIPRGCSFVDSNFYASVTIYFQSTKPGDVIEIVAYS